MQKELKWTPWTPMIDVGFWTSLAKRKLEEYKLTAEDRPLITRYKLSQMPDKMSILTVDAFSFEHVAQERMGPVQIKIAGSFLNTNTKEEFDGTNLDEEEDALLKREISDIKDFIEGKVKTLTPSIKLLVFADLKKYMFSYYLLSVAVMVKGYETVEIESLKDNAKMNEVLNKALKDFVINKEIPVRLVVLKREKESESEDYVLSSVGEFIDNHDVEYLFGYVDTVSEPTSTGISTSSLLALFAWLKSEYKVPAERLTRVKVWLIKDFMIYNLEKKYSFRNSLLWTLDLSNVEFDITKTKLSQPRKLMELDLKSFMDERSLIKDAVDLNIKLMKWRLLPRLDIPKIQSKKCLLFGAGTLGCQLARNLIGWGIKNISFIDYSNVSYSNPVRQSLYEYEDTIKGGKPKALVAAEKLKKIYPEIESTGYHISVPMPGHFVTTEKQIQETFHNLEIIENLVKEHDVLFLLLDSREARWLPTLLANKYDKACITVGLGFDSFMIVRHGVSPNIYDPAVHKERLSCYFCNDIASPQNTMKDRTLDQMCTVTRPGLSFVSSAYASQMYISLIHHPLEHRVWAHEDSSKLEETDLGKLPHHVRGNMSDFEVNIFYGRAFDQCVACSKKVLDEYSNNKEEFMLGVLNNPQYIHDVTGLADDIRQMENNTEDFIEIIDDDEITQEILQGKREEKEEKIEKDQNTQ